MPIKIRSTRAWSLFEWSQCDVTTINKSKYTVPAYAAESSRGIGAEGGAMTGGLVILATFLAAAVEWVEALTIVLAVGMVKSWRTALVATAAALGVLAVGVLVFGFALTSYVSVPTVRTLVGIGLLLFGLGWLSKAILRSSGLKAPHHPGKAFAHARQYSIPH